jgi:RecA-family ATPase
MSMTFTTVSQLARYKPNANDDFLIGAGFLNRGGSMLLTGEPGGGKSKCIQHAMFSFALGSPFLGFKPVRALKVLYIQNEDTMDDMHESLMGFVQQHGLSKADLNLINDNCVLVHASGLSGEEFVLEVRHAVEKHKPDIVITDPLLAFIGCDLTDQVGVTTFLRDGMAPLLQTHRWMDLRSSFVQGCNW